jgi:PAS domain S-box-containing protein
MKRFITRPIARYCIAVLATGAAFFLRQELTLYVGAGMPPYVTLLPAVMLTAMLCGLGPGLLATAATALLALQWILPPEGAFFPLSPVDAVGLGLFLIMGGGMSLVAELYHRARHRAAAYAQELAVQAGQARAAAEIERQRQLLAVTLTSIGDAVIVTDTQGRVTFLNSEAERLTGWTGSEVVGKPLHSVYRIVHAQTRQRVESPADKALRLGTVVGLANHTLLLTKDGRETPIDHSAAPVRQGDGTVYGVVLVFRDITARQRLEEERLIRSKLESTGILAGGIAHDFNNLLMIILGSLELLELPGQAIAPHLEAMKQATLEAHALTEQFLTFAKGGGPVRRVLALAGVLRDAATLALRGAPVACDMAIAEDLWPMEGDPAQLGQVARNLILNAREAMPTGGRIVVRAENVPRPTPTVRVTVADLGPGIPAEVLPKIFDPYFSTKERGGTRGTGLGLTVCRAIVDQHGGTLTVDSTVGVGTTVRVDLPAAPTAVLVAPSPPPAPRPGAGRLLVMDDEGGVRTAVGALLQRLGYAVELTAHGAEAVERYQAAQARGEPFAAVLLDLTVRGGMGGVPTLEALRRLDPTVKAIASSGYADDPVLVEPARYGFRGALAKPYGVAELRERLAEVLGG